ncbi:MAG: aldose 1-epimerase [Bacteroidetes bacterium]|nr:aldose 1-epimerase [Bacteroidota bacterium]
MFGINRKIENGFEILQLKDELYGCSVEIVPSCGAMLRAFIIKDENGEFNLIDSYSNKEQYDESKESSGFKGLKLSPFPCRIKKGTYTFNGREYKLLPNHGEVVLHGFLYNKSFNIIEEYADAVAARVILCYKYEGEMAGYPFAYSCTITYTLEKGNKLSVNTSILNAGDISMPIADGWHPYFSFGRKVNDLLLEFRSEKMLEFVNLLPTGGIIPFGEFLQLSPIGDKEIDNSFVLDFTQPQPMCTLRDPKSKIQLEIHPGQGYPYLQIYIPPHRRSVAIENLSAPPDAFNNGMGLITVDPGETAEFSTTYKVTSYN